MLKKPKLLDGFQESIFFLIRVCLIYSVVLVAAIEQSESVIHIHVSTLFLKILFPYRSLQSIEFPVLLT